MSTSSGSNAGSLTDTFAADAESRLEESTDAIAPRATGNILFSANPVDQSTITLQGTVITFATAPSAGQVQIAGTLALTLVNLLAILRASVDANINLMDYSIDATHLYVMADAGGVTGNAYTLAASTSPASHGTVSAGTLAGGSLSFVTWKNRIAGQIGATPPFPLILVNG